MNIGDFKKATRGLLAAFGLVFLSCDSGSNPPPPVEYLRGKWDFIGVSNKNEVTTLPESAEYPPSVSESDRDIAGDGYYIEFEPDFSYSATFPSTIGASKKGSNAAADPTVTTGEWSGGDSVLFLIQSEGMDRDTTRFTILMEGDSLTLTSSTTFSFPVADGYVSTAVTSFTYVAEKDASP